MKIERDRLIRNVCYRARWKKPLIKNELSRICTEEDNPSLFKEH